MSNAQALTDEAYSITMQSPFYLYIFQRKPRPIKLLSVLRQPNFFHFSLLIKIYKENVLNELKHHVKKKLTFNHPPSGLSPQNPLAIHLVLFIAAHHCKRHGIL